MFRKAKQKPRQRVWYTLWNPMIKAGVNGFYFKSFTRFFSKNRSFQRQYLWSSPADDEIPPPYKRAGRGMGEPYQGVPPYFFDRLTPQLFQCCGVSVCRSVLQRQILCAFRSLAIFQMICYNEINSSHPIQKRSSICHIPIM